MDRQTPEYFAKVNLENERHYRAARAASYDFLSDAKDEIWELLIAVRDSFDGSEYQQGKKDGLRSALAILGTPEMASFNRGGGMARPVPGWEGEVKL